MAQEQQPSRSHQSEETSPDTEQAGAASDLAERKATLDADVDDLLDEIDDVLETNAEDFVKSFIQKGGQ